MTGATGTSDSQLIEPMFDVRRQILMKETQRASASAKSTAPYEFESCDNEQGLRRRVGETVSWQALPLYGSSLFFAGQRRT